MSVLSDRNSISPIHLKRSPMLIGLHLGLFCLSYYAILLIAFPYWIKIALLGFFTTILAKSLREVSFRRAKDIVAIAISDDTKTIHLIDALGEFKSFTSYKIKRIAGLIMILKAGKHSILIASDAVSKPSWSRLAWLAWHVKHSDSLK